MAVQPRPPFRSLVGKYFGLGPRGELAARGDGVNARRLTSPVVHVTGTIGAEVANARTITLQLRDAYGKAIDYAAMVDVIVFLNSGMTDFAATGGSTGIAQGATGKLLAVVAKKIFRAISAVTGELVFTYTDTGTEACHLGVRLPNGELVYIGNMTNA